MSEPEGQRLRVLVVDDEKINLDTIARVFRHAFDIVPARSGKDAIVLLDTSTFDIALVDYSMPEMDGVAFFEEAVRRQPAMIRVALTGYGDQPELVEARRSGLCTEIVWKPWRAAELEALIRRLIATRLP